MTIPSKNRYLVKVDFYKIEKVDHLGLLEKEVEEMGIEFTSQNTSESFFSANDFKSFWNLYGLYKKTTPLCYGTEWVWLN